MALLQKTLFDFNLSDDIETGKAISKEQAELLFTFFKKCTTFRWADANNNCEARANAMSILLDTWEIPNAKGWAFSGYVFKKTGYLKNLWKYHVATLVPVLEHDAISMYIIDPATLDTLATVEDWAINITGNPHSYYFIKKSDYYIFNAYKIKKDNWHKRDKRNFNWTMQGLSGINGVSAKGKAQLIFNKKRVLKTKEAFNNLQQMKSPIL